MNKQQIEQQLNQELAFMMIPKNLNDSGIHAEDFDTDDAEVQSWCDKQKVNNKDVLSNSSQFS